MQHILIIEDEESLADFLELELKYEGYKVDIQLDGRKGLSATLEKNYDLIFLDLMSAWIKWTRGMSSTKSD